MRIGITSDCLMWICPDEHEALAKYAKLGITALDYSGYCHDGPNSRYLQPDWEEYAYSLREEADRLGIIYSQVHAPMLSYHDQPETAARKLKITCRMFRLCEILGAPYLVVHPKMFADGINGEHQEKYLAVNVEFYKSLLPLAAKHKVAVALENMFGWDPQVSRICRTTFSTMEEILECIHRLNSDWATVCLDTGHVNLLRESPAIAARKLGSHLKLLHVHDNYGIDDNHLACGYGIIDWDGFIETLKEIGYTGEFSSEATGAIDALPRELSEQGVRLVGDISRAFLARHGIPAE